MTLSRPAAACAQMALLLTLACPFARAGLDESAQLRLQTLGAHPALAGELIYRGRTFALDSAASDPLFHYERRLRETPAASTATHLTRDPAQQLVVVEEAQFGPHYQLHRFVALNRQLGYSGEVALSRDGRHLRYRLVDNGVTTLAQETIDRPAVSGPTLFGFILAHAAELDAGQTVPVSMIVLKDKRSYGFDIRREAAGADQVVYTLTASSVWLRPFIATMRLVVDSSRTRVLRYLGRVPPMSGTAGKLSELDARVEYTPAAPAYR